MNDLRARMKTLIGIITTVLLPISIYSGTVNITVVGSGPGTPPVPGVKVVLIQGNGFGPHVDSGTSDATGLVTFLNVSIGIYVVQASKSGYNNGVILIDVNTIPQIVNANVNSLINNWTSTIQGFVKKASDSSSMAGVLVTLSGGPCGDNPKNILTDSSGHYKLDSVCTGTGHNVAVNLFGYLGTSAGNVAVAWNAITTVGTLYLTSNRGSISGTIRRNDSATIVIPGAKVMFLNGTAKVDSITTDANGNYSKVLNTASYNIRVSAVGMKSNRGLPTKDTMATLVFGSNTVMNTGLTPALSTIGGTIHGTNATTGPIVSGAKVVLQRRMASTPAAQAVYYTLDSTITDANGIFSFSNLIAAPAPASATNGSYHVLVNANGFRTYPNTPAENTADVYQVAYGATYIVTPNIALFIQPISINSVHSNAGQPIHFSLMGDQLIMNLNSSSVVRTLEIFDLKGVLQRTIQIPANESRITLPASFAPEKGFLYGLK